LLISVLCQVLHQCVRDVLKTYSLREDTGELVKCGVGAAPSRRSPKWDAVLDTLRAAGILGGLDLEGILIHLEQGNLPLASQFSELEDL
jgi:hypothetical protein